MTPTPEQIAHVLELDSKRQKEAEKLHKNRVKALDGYEFDTTKYIELKSLMPAHDAFIAAAPLMAQIIRHQQEQLRVARGLLEQAQSLLSWFRTAPNFTGWKHPSQAAQYDNVMQALSLIGDKA
jgi:hypothetical protein